MGKMKKELRKLLKKRIKNKHYPYPLIDQEAIIACYGTNLIPQDEIARFKVRPGFYTQNGAVVMPGGVSFTIHSQNATFVSLALFHRNEEEPFAVLPFPSRYRIGDVYSMIVFDLDITEIEYAYIIDGPYDPARGLIFDSERYVLDPYSRAVAGRSVWGEKNRSVIYRGRIVGANFDWGNSVSPNYKLEDLIIYELHVRGFTQHISSDVKYPGTFEGLKEKIPYLLELGVTCVELMPVFEFDEMGDDRIHNGRQLYDYWGYNPISFFAPNTAYMSKIEAGKEGLELKDLIRTLHDHGIEVFLDVVFNHTAEGNENGPFISFKGLDNNVYYMLSPDGKYYNFSGCGNTLNANHPVVQQMVIESLRYWRTEYRIDGFRFDLASILGRSEDGTPINNPPLLKNLAFDPILSDVKLIAEAWDAAGLYQVGSFPSWHRWSEWNGKYRDDIRKFLRGDENLAWTVAQRICGSHDLYDPVHRGEDASINFVTCHDGFTLRDVFSYNVKHNEENGWDNTDGENYNHSTNCGFEGEIDDERINALRRKMVKNACAILLFSHGTPMILAGDEFYNTQGGNNNPYCQDNEISWLNWRQRESEADIFEFFRYMIHLRKEHPAMRDGYADAFCGFPKVSVHGEKAWHLDHDTQTRTVGVMFAYSIEDTNKDDIVYLALNSAAESKTMELPRLPEKMKWEAVINTAAGAYKDYGPAVEQSILTEENLHIAAQSTVLLLARETE